MRRLAAAVSAVLLLAVGPAAPAFARETAVAPSVRLEGAPNFRDLGGYATGDGRHVVLGLVFRSEKLSELTPADVARIKGLGIRNVIDLRTAEERRREPDDWRAPAVYESPKPDLAATVGMRDPNATPEEIRARMIRNYEQMPALYVDEYSAFFRRLVAGGAPLIVHCTAGKDRTGVASALLLSALGVRRSTVVADYVLTNERLVVRPPAMRAASLVSVSAPARRVLMSADPAFINAALDSVDRQYGSVEGYLKQALGLADRDIATLRRRLTR
jgi:protein-tyrosine phosphatase